MAQINFSIITLALFIPGLSIFGLKLLILNQTHPFIGALVLAPFCLILFVLFIALNLSIKETFYFLVIHLIVYVLTAQLAREYIHIYTFSLLGAHLQKQFPKLLTIHILTGALASYFDEYLQLYVPSRFFDTNDILLNFVSFLSGVAFLKVLRMKKR